jgi:hypothetical protein
MMIGYPRIRGVEALPDKQLRVNFENGDIRIYDCRSLLDEQPFKPLANDAFFRTVQVDRHGYGVSWSDEIDLSESELWLNGVAQPRTEAELG